MSVRVLKRDWLGGQSPFFGPWLSDQGLAASEALLVDDSPPAAAVAAGVQVRRVEHPGQLLSVLASTGNGLPVPRCVTTCASGRERPG